MGKVLESGFLEQLISLLNVNGDIIMAENREGQNYNIIVINNSSDKEENKNLSDKKDMKTYILMKLMKFGIPTRLKGYKYIATAIELVLEDETALDGVTKVLYPDVAKRYNSTPQRVEKAIRHAIEVAWAENSAELRKEFEDGKSNKRPTNSEFISRMSKYIKMIA